jgi:hypothetical protein
MNIDQEYNKILHQLKAGGRPNIKLSKSDFSQLLSLWPKPVQYNQKKEVFLKILCILENTQNFAPQFLNPIIEVLENSKDKELVIHTLGISQKHILSCFQMKGERVPISFIKSIGHALGSSEPEVIEWGLRVLEQSGSAGILLKEDVRSLNIPFFKRWNSKWKIVSSLKNFILNQWKPLGPR